MEQHCYVVAISFFFCSVSISISFSLSLSFSLGFSMELTELPFSLWNIFMSQRNENNVNSRLNLALLAYINFVITIFLFVSLLKPDHSCALCFLLFCPEKVTHMVRLLDLSVFLCLLFFSFFLSMRFFSSLEIQPIFFSFCF